MNELALFAGAGGGILGGHLLGWRTVCAVEWESYPASVLCARQNDGLLPSFPIWDDVQTFDGKPWRGIVDVVSGGFPCQDISAAGRGGGIEAERSGMWKEMARIIGEVRPKFAFVENSPMLTTRGLGTVLRDLAKMGFDAEWGVLSAANVGANHKRERIWILAYSNSNSNFRQKPRSAGLQNKTKRKPRSQHSSTWQSSGTSSLLRQDALQRYEESNMADSRRKLWNEGNSRNLATNQTKRTASSILNQSSSPRFGFNDNWWKIEPNVGRMANGLVAGVDRLKAIGNGQVPLCAATAWELLRKRLDE